jgi:SAM-dependent methyltransferase
VNALRTGPGRVEARPDLSAVVAEEVSDGLGVLVLGAPGPELFGWLDERRGRSVLVVPEGHGGGDPPGDDVIRADPDVAGWEDLLHGERFDVVLVADALGWSGDPAVLLARARTLVRPGGRVVVSALNAAHAATRLRLLTGRATPPQRVLGLDELEGALGRAGLLLGEVRRQTATLEGSGAAELVARLPEDLVGALLRAPEATTHRFLLVAYAPMSEGQLLHRLRRLEDRVDALSGEAASRAGDDRELRSLLGVDDGGSLDGFRQGLAAISRSLVSTAGAPATHSGPNGQGYRRNGRPHVDDGYRRVIAKIREVVRAALPAGATVIVVSRGDDELTRLDGRTGWHFPQGLSGVYAGHHPADSAEAIRHLEDLRTRGGQFLLVPATAFWWLTHYKEFARHLDEAHELVLKADDACVIYRLRGR